MKQKRQSPAQRVANPVWLREQIGKLVNDCAANIEYDQELADKTRGDDRGVYLARVESHQHWKRQLERILRGKTFNEELRDAVRIPMKSDPGNT